MDAHDEPERAVCLCCRRELTDDLGRLACSRCEHRMARDLGDVARLWRHLPALVEKGASRAADEHSVTSSGPDGSAAPGNLAALDLLAGDVVRVLIVHEDAWRRELRRTYPRLPLTPWRGNQDQTLHGVLAFLAAWLRWACLNYDGVEDFYRDLNVLLRTMRQVATGERPQRPEPLPVPCPLRGGGEACGGQLVYEPRHRHIECRDCRREVGIAYWADLAEAVGLFLDHPDAA